MKGNLPYFEWPVPSFIAILDYSDVLFLFFVSFLTAAMPRDHFFLKMTLDVVIILFTGVIQDSLLPTVSMFLGLGCEVPLSVVNVLPGRFIYRFCIKY